MSDHEQHTGFVLQTVVFAFCLHVKFCWECGKQHHTLSYNYPTLSLEVNMSRINSTYLDNLRRHPSHHSKTYLMRSQIMPSPVLEAWYTWQRVSTLNLLSYINCWQTKQKKHLGVQFLLGYVKQISPTKLLIKRATLDLLRDARIFSQNSNCLQPGQIWPNWEQRFSNIFNNSCLSDVYKLSYYSHSPSPPHIVIWWCS